MQKFRLIILILLALFVSDVVMAAPAGVAMQFASVQDTGDMPCHMDAGHVQSAPDDGAPAHGKCHQCMACVVMMAVGLEPASPVRHVGTDIPFVAAAYRARIISPSSRPPIAS